VPAGKCKSSKASPGSRWPVGRAKDRRARDQARDRARKDPLAKKEKNKKEFDRKDEGQRLEELDKARRKNRNLIDDDSRTKQRDKKELQDQADKENDGWWDWLLDWL